MLCDSPPAKDGPEFSMLARKIYQILDDAYEAGGNNAVRLYKMMEPICIGVILES